MCPNLRNAGLGVKDKAALVQSIAARRGIPLSVIAYIGDDVNDLEAFSLVGLSACPQDALEAVKERVVSSAILKAVKALSGSLRR